MLQEKVERVGAVEGFAGHPEDVGSSQRGGAWTSGPAGGKETQYNEKKGGNERFAMDIHMRVPD
jgi:hypothetical protein